MTGHPALNLAEVSEDALRRAKKKLNALHKRNPVGLCQERFELLILGKLIELPVGKALTFSSLFDFVETHRQIDPDEKWLADSHERCLLADQAWSAVCELLSPTPPPA